MEEIATVAGREWIQSISSTDLETAAVLRGLEADLMYRLCNLCYPMLLKHAANCPSQKSMLILTESEDQSTFWRLMAHLQKTRNIRERRLRFKEQQVPPNLSKVETNK